MCEVQIPRTSLPLSSPGVSSVGSSSKYTFSPGSRWVDVAPDVDVGIASLTDGLGIEDARRNDAVHAAVVFEQGRVAGGVALSNARLERLQHAALLGSGGQGFELGRGLVDDRPCARTAPWPSGVTSSTWPSSSRFQRQVGLAAVQLLAALQDGLHDVVAAVPEADHVAGQQVSTVGWRAWGGAYRDPAPAAGRDSGG